MQDSLIDAWPHYFEQYRATPPAILLQKNTLFLAGSTVCGTNLYYDTPSSCIKILLGKYRGQLLLAHLQYDIAIGDKTITYLTLIPGELF